MMETFNETPNASELKQLEKNKVHLGNCFDLFPHIEKGSVSLIVCDGPYGVTNHEWDKISNIQDYNLKLIKEFSRILKPGGTAYLFGKSNGIHFIDYTPYLKYEDTIVWSQMSRLSQGRKKLTNNYDAIFYFSKEGGEKTFNLDDIRVPQMVSKEQRARVENVPSVVNGKYGKTKYNENGKNPGNVWSHIKQLTYKSKELIGKEFLNTIQKPEELIKLLVKASSNSGDLVLDPFSGVGTTFSVCKQLDRDFIGFEINPKYVEVTNERIEKLSQSAE